MTIEQTKLDAEQLAASIKWDDKGLVPAIVQDAVSKEVLMLAYMNRESLERTLESGETWFWSRSRQGLWNKGATSGNTQRVVSLAYDCDGDTLLVKVVPNGPACHNGTYTCFQQETKVQATENLPQDRYAIINKLESIIAQRDAERPEGAYTTYLFEKGIDKTLKKVGEEAGEVIIAAKNNDHAEMRWEVADLLFHLLVLLRQSKLPLDDVLRELDERHNRKSTKEAEA